MKVKWCGLSGAQSRLSAKLFLQSSELGLPHPLAAGECAPHPPFGPGGGQTRLRERGWGWSQFRRGNIRVLYTVVLYGMYISTLWSGAMHSESLPVPVRGEWPVRTVGEVCIRRDAAARQQLQRHLAHRTEPNKRTFFAAGRFSRGVFLSRRFLKWPCHLSIHKKIYQYFQFLLQLESQCYGTGPETWTGKAGTGALCLSGTGMQLIRIRHKMKGKSQRSQKNKKWCNFLGNSAAYNIKTHDFSTKFLSGKTNLNMVWIRNGNFSELGTRTTPGTGINTVVSVPKHCLLVS